MIRILLRLVALIQLVLGLLYLFAPHWLLARMGHSAPAPDLLYPLGMLAARFIAYGLGLWVASAAPARHRLWLRLMALIQLIDLGAGVAATVSGTVSLALSAFPMFNAVWIAALCAVAGREETAAPRRPEAMAQPARG